MAEREMSTVTGKDVSRYRWQCRRGMLELDILLNKFVDEQMNDLSTAQQEVFDRLLSYPDQALLDLLLGHSTSRDPEITLLVQQIRSTFFS